MISGTAQSKLFARTSQGVVSALCVGAVSGVAITLSIATGGSSPWTVLATASGIAAVLWLFVTERYEWSLMVVLLYVGLADGYLKLSTNSQLATLGRDVLLYSVVSGAVIRMLIRRDAVRFPPLTGWIVGLVALVLVEVLNPGNTELGSAIAATRQHLEFVPLFFAGFALLTTSRRLRIFFLVLGAVATINGIVALVQLSLTPDQLAAWGPGYKEFIFGTGDVSGRVYLDSNGVGRIRPFALGGDVGFGGNVGLVACSGVLAVIGLIGKQKAAIPAVFLMAGVLLAVVTSQGRAAVIATIITVAAFLFFGVIGRQSLRPVIALALVVALASLVIPRVVGSAEEGTYDRYQSIAPTKALDTAYTYRIDDLGHLPEYVRTYPLGAGLGTLGPASSLRSVKSTLNGETNFGFLVVELGVVGLILLFGFTIRVLLLAGSRIRRVDDHETRLLLAGLAAPLVGILLAWISGPALAGPPFAPYFWLASGALSYWLLARSRAEVSVGSAPGS